MIFDEGWSGLAFVLVAGFLATDIWRVLGVYASAGIDEDGELFRWVRAVATALVAALVTRIVFFPPGALADTPLILRAAAFAAGCVVIFTGVRSLAIPILVGEVVLVAGLVWI
jgi:hypothetical protein